MTMTGMTTISIKATAVSSRLRSASAMGPLGSRTGTWLRSQPLPSSAAPKAIAIRCDLCAKACFAIAFMSFVAQLAARICVDR